MSGTGLCPALGLVITPRDSWGQEGKEKLSKRRFAASIDKSSSGDQRVSHQAGSFQSIL